MTLTCETSNTTFLDLIWLCAKLSCSILIFYTSMYYVFDVIFVYIIMIIIMIIIAYINTNVSFFSALTMLVVRQELHLTLKTYSFKPLI